MDTIEQLLKESERLFQLVKKTECVVGSLGMLYFTPPFRAHRALREMFPHDWAHLGKLFEIEVTIGEPSVVQRFPELVMRLQELYELHQKVVVAHARSDLDVAESTLHKAENIFDRLIAELKTIKAILCKHANVYMQNRTVMADWDEGVPTSDEQKRFNADKTAVIEAWVIGLPANRSLLDSGYTAAQVYDATFATPERDWQRAHLHLEDRYPAVVIDRGFGRELDAETQAIIDAGGIDPLWLCAMEDLEEQNRMDQEDQQND